MSKYKLFILALYITEAVLQNPCENNKNCRDCILDSNVCVWCADDDHKESSRCTLESKVTEKWCSKLERPNTTVVKDPTKPTPDDAQIKPQRYNLKLLPGKPVDFNFTFNSMKNYPVDIYFVIDASKTMRPHKMNTANQAKNIYDTLKNMTENIRLGLGTFIDKNALPFTDNVKNNDCYSFKHHLNLTSSYTEFQRKVESYESGGNVDLPEGGFDALSQAIACKDFGWRNRSAKIVVYMTDAPFHAAGDGRVAGIFEPYDGECYTNAADGVYTKELEMDYPSIGMINKLATENDVIILFAIKVATTSGSTDTNGDEYVKLTEAIIGSELLKITQAKNEDLVKKLKGIYERISTRIKLRVQYKEDARKNFQITFNPDCTKDIDACKVIKDEPQHFTASITLKQYQGVDNYNLDIAVEGITDKLTLGVEVIKQCECESKIEKPSLYCNGESRQCGICICSEESKKYGERCLCTGNSQASQANSTCIDGNTPDVLCNDQGTCDCGKCSCAPGYGGQYCECSLNNCPRINNELCSGHGTCGCSGCKCLPDYSGDACQCYLSDEACRADNKKICSNRGKCDCGKCKCDEIASWDKRTSYDKKFCTMDPCPGCHNLQCTSITPCVACLLKTNDSCPCEGLKVEVVETINNDLLNDTDSEWNVCNKVKVDVGCYTKFIYQYDDEEYRIVVMMQREKDCLETYYLYGGGVLVSIVIIGILTLFVWKVLTEINYRNEYRKFVEENKTYLTGPSTNPLYEDPTTVFRNPAFRKRSIN